MKRPKGISGLCQINACQNIAEWTTPFERQLNVRDIGLEQVIQVCDSHVKDKSGKVDRMAQRIPYIVRKGGELLIKCQRCGEVWKPNGFNMPKDDKDYGRLPKKCNNQRCRQPLISKIRKIAGPAFRKTKNRVTGGANRARSTR